MSQTLEAIQVLFRLGHHAQIVDELGPARNLLPSVQPEHRLIAAHALFHVGDSQRADAIVQKENHPGASTRIRSHCELISGLLRRRDGSLADAQRHFQLSLQLAKDARDPDRIAWAALQRFRTLAEADPNDTLSAMLTEVRQYVTLAGDPHVSAYMHDSIALMEASVGRPAEARRHLNICYSLLERHPNAWLEQVASINGFFIDFLECKYTEALQNLRIAKKLLTLTGGRQKAVIECNEGHALLVLGRFSSAAERLQQIAGTQSRVPAIAALDGLARAYLATDRLDECEQTLEELTRLVGGDSVARQPLRVGGRRLLGANLCCVEDVTKKPSNS